MIYQPCAMTTKNYQSYAIICIIPLQNTHLVQIRGKFLRYCPLMLAASPFCKLSTAPSFITIASSTTKTPTQLLTTAVVARLPSICRTATQHGIGILSIEVCNTAEARMVLTRQHCCIEWPAAQQTRPTSRWQQRWWRGCQGSTGQGNRHAKTLKTGQGFGMSRLMVSLGLARRTAHMHTQLFAMALEDGGITIEYMPMLYDIEHCVKQRDEQPGIPDATCSTRRF